MKYRKIVTGKFIDRPNRFVARVELEGEIISVHVKNTGRCKELLIKGATVYLEDSRNKESRKLPFSLIAVKKPCRQGEMLINMDSQAPNKVVKEALEGGNLILPNLSSLQTIKSEAVYGDSRLDFYVEDINGVKGYIEVKGVTLENEGIVSFPDAPTLRGIKHIKELESLAQKGLKAYIIFVIQMEGAKLFTPNAERHPEFSKALCQASKNGVTVLAYDCRVTADSLTLNKEVKISL